MSHDDLDLRLGAWLQEGPERAHPAVVDATFAPLGRLPQRRAWRVSVETRLPRRRTLALLAVAALLVVAFALGPGGPGGRFAPPAPTPSPRPAPSWALTMTGISGTARSRSDGAAALDSCDTPPNGTWSFIYSGGKPLSVLDLLVADGAAAAPGSDRVALEVNAPDYSVRFDPAQLRGGDAPGRSTASVTVTRGPGGWTIRVHATTPDTSTTAGDPVTVDLTLVCP